MMELNHKVCEELAKECYITPETRGIAIGILKKIGITNIPENFGKVDIVKKEPKKEDSKSTEEYQSNLDELQKDFTKATVNP